MIYQYFHAGFTYEEIIALQRGIMELKSVFVLCIDYYDSKNVYRKSVQDPVPVAVSFIQLESQGNGSYIGYRAMQQRCINNRLNVSRAVVT